MFDNEATQFFYEITPERILTAVEELGVRCTGKIIPLNSVENRVYDVELDIPKEDLQSKYQASRVIKFYRPGRWSKEQILEEHQFIRDLEERDLPVVSPLNFLDGTSVRSVPGLANDLYFSIFPKIGGRILDEYTDAQIAMLGRFIARMHQVGRSEKAKHRNVLTTQSYGLDNCKYLLEKQILPPEIQNRYIQLVEQICETSAPWFETVPLQRLHGDCHLGNILWIDEACTFVDFDDFIMGPPIQDLWLIVPGRDEWSVKQRNLLIDSY
ncbi:MAG: serine/threonine protein kinase, partial [Candidatus Paceibacterota bacterium]